MKRFNQDWKIAPLPSGTRGWIVTAARKIEGPYPVAAIGCEVDLAVGREEGDPDLHLSIFDVCANYYLVLADFLGDSPWVPQGNVFFSREAAEARGRY